MGRGAWLYSGKLHFAAQSGAWVFLLCGAQLAIWTLVPRLLAISLPLDVVGNGGIPWGHEWQWGYFEHPPLPSWLVALFFELLGDTGPFLLSQIAVVITYAFVFALGRELMPATKWAAVGTLLLVGVYYFSIPTPEFNHGIAQLPLWAGATFAYYKALHSQNLRWWVGLGLLAGLGMLAKYSTGLLLATMAIHALSSAPSRKVLRSAGPYVAFAIFCLVLSPHIAWLVQHDFPTFQYAARRAGHASSFLSRFVAPANFLFTQILDIAFALAIATAGGFLSRDVLLRKLQSYDEDDWFLLVMTLGPVALAVLISLVSGLGLRTMWGVPMWNLVGLLVVRLGRDRWSQASIKRIAILCTALFLVMPFCYAIATTVAPYFLNQPSRTAWPDREIAQAFSSAWQEETGTRLQIVAGEGWLSGLIAIRTEPMPHVWTNASFIETPWISPALVCMDGALVVWNVKDRHTERLTTLPGLRFEGVKDFAWPRGHIPSLRIAWGVVPPNAPAYCR